jgi:hypothetical protein
VVAADLRRPEQDVANGGRVPSRTALRGRHARPPKPDTELAAQAGVSSCSEAGQRVARELGLGLAEANRLDAPAGAATLGQSAG